MMGGPSPGLEDFSSEEVRLNRSRCFSNRCHGESVGTYCPPSFHCIRLVYSKRKKSTKVNKEVRWLANCSLADFSPRAWHLWK